MLRLGVEAVEAVVAVVAVEVNLKGHGYQVSNEVSMRECIYE